MTFRSVWCPRPHLNAHTHTLAGTPEHSQVSVPHAWRHPAGMLLPPHCCCLHYRYEKPFHPVCVRNRNVRARETRKIKVANTMKMFGGKLRGERDRKSIAWHCFARLALPEPVRMMCDIVLRRHPRRCNVIYQLCTALWIGKGLRMRAARASECSCDVVVTGTI